MQDAEADCTDLAEGTRVCFVRAMKVPRFLRITPVLPRIVGSDDVVLLNFGEALSLLLDPPCRAGRRSSICNQRQDPSLLLERLAEQRCGKRGGTSFFRSLWRI